MKFGSTQPATLEPIPKQNRVHLPSELINAPKALIADLFARRIERNAVEFAERVDFVPMRADITVFERDVIEAARFPSIVTAATRIETASLHQQFGQACDGARNASRFVGREVAVAERPFL